MKNTQKSSDLNNPNSFYNIGGIEILSLEQDEISKLWKIYLSTAEHYLVSREFDRSVGLYANAPDDVIRQGLMDFSDSLIGKQFSLWKVMDLFIDRCFDESIFDEYTANAVWMSFDYPSYPQFEEIISTYNCRLKWFDANSYMGNLLSSAMRKTLAGDYKHNLAKELKSGFSDNGITTVFMNPDKISQKFISDAEFENVPTFIGDFSENGDFLKFDYMRR